MIDAYIKKGRRYEPIGTCVCDTTLTEGVWVVTKNKGSKSICRADYLDNIYQLDKCSELQKLTIAQRGYLDKITEESLNAYLGQHLSAYELAKRVVADVVNKLMKE